MRAIDIMVNSGGGGAHLSNQNVTGSAGNPAVATAQYLVKSDGNVYQRLNLGSTDFLETWMLQGPNTQYAVFAHVNSGNVPTGSALDTELPMTADYGWQLQQGTIGTKTCNLAVQIRDALTHQILTSAVIVITADDS